MPNHIIADGLGLFCRATVGRKGVPEFDLPGSGHGQHAQHCLQSDHLFFQHGLQASGDQADSARLL